MAGKDRRVQKGIGIDRCLVFSTGKGLNTSQKRRVYLNNPRVSNDRLSAVCHMRSLRGDCQPHSYFLGISWGRAGLQQNVLARGLSAVYRIRLGFRRAPPARSFSSPMRGRASTSFGEGTARVVGSTFLQYLQYLHTKVLLFYASIATLLILVLDSPT